MVDDLEERLSRYRADLDAAVASDLARRHLASREAGFSDADPLLLDTDHAIRLEPAMSARHDRRRVMLVATIGVAAAVTTLVFVALVVSREGDDGTPADQPSPTVTVPPTAIVSPTLPPGTWSPELTARPLETPIDCNQPPASHCGHLVVSPAGTLVGLDKTGKTLTWYEEEPRAVSLAREIGSHILWAIGPYDIAYIGTPRDLIAVAPSGVEITRMLWPSNKSVIPTATGLVSGWIPEWSPPDALLMPWVDLDGNPITDATHYPTLARTQAGIEVRFGEREWLLAESDVVVNPGLETPYLLALGPRSDGGVVVVLDTDPPEANLVELLPDGTIDHRYFIENTWPLTILPDGSMIVEHNRELISVTPPA